MADDLGEEWWLEENAENEETNCQGEKETEVVEADKKSKKRKKVELDVEKLKPSERQETIEVTTTPKTKKKRKKKRKEETVEQTIIGKDTREIFWSSFYKCFEGKLTSLEVEDLRIEDEVFLTDDTVHTGDLKELTSYLNTVCPKWSRLVSKLDAKNSKGSPAVLLVTSAATRATDVLRASVDFRQNGKAMKLFSKHMKFEEQEKYLEEHIVHLGVGTPNRIYKLIKSGALHVSHLKSVILDWTWRDAKQRRLMDIPEIQQDILTLLKELVLGKDQKRQITLGLF